MVASGDYQYEYVREWVGQFKGDMRSMGNNTGERNQDNLGQIDLLLDGGGTDEEKNR